MSKKILNKVLKNFKKDVDSFQYTEWRIQAAEDQDFYDGRQINAKDLKELEDRGQPSITINEVAPKVDSLSNQEIQNQTKIIYNSRSFDKEFEVLADSMTTLALNVQSNADTVYEISDVFVDQLKAGIGWLEVGFDEGMITTNRVQPFMVVWDTNDETPQLTDSDHVSKMKWFSVDKAKMLFPKKANEISKLFDNDENGNILGVVGSQQPSTGKYTLSGSDREPFSFLDQKTNKILIIEQQYKKPSTKYRYVNEEGQQKETFSLAFAKKNVIKDSEIQTIHTFEIWRAFFTENILFENLPHDVQIGDFTIIPTIHKREDRTHVPYGVITNSKDPQIELNKRRSKTLHLMNTKGVVYEDGAVDDIDVVASEISRPDYMIKVNKGKAFDIQDNLALADSQNSVMLQSKEDISTTMGVFNENIGQQTNVTSGVGIQRRQSASIGNKGFAFNNFNRFKKRFGVVLGHTMQTVFSEQYLLQVFDEAGESIILNKPYEKNGKQYFENDLSTLFFGVTVAQIPNFEADPEVLAENLTNMAMNGQLQIVLQSPTLAKRMGLRDIEEIQQEMQDAGGIPSPEQAQDGTEQQ